MYRLSIVLFLLSGISGCKAQEKEISDPVRYWDLPTGSHIAYTCFLSEDSLNSVPLIFLHGGPGAYQVSSVEIGRKWYDHLADLGFDVYIYDQVGSGLSGRLNNPADYTVKRHINDLEEIRKIIGNKKIILTGDSWGAILASNYMADYPDNVVKAVFTSPGPLDFDNWNIKSATPRLAPEFLQWIKEKSGEKNYRHYLKLDSLLQKKHFNCLSVCR